MIDAIRRGPAFRIVRDGNTAGLSGSELFSKAHQFWFRGSYREAAELLERLIEDPDHRQRAAVFLAHCRVMIGNYAGSIAVLSQAFPREQFGDTAAKLHDAFVYWRVGLLIDVKRSLKELARENRESPIYGLLLGDLMQQSGAPEHSHRFYQYAIEHDQVGSIALAAKDCLNQAESQ